MKLLGRAQGIPECGIKPRYYRDLARARKYNNASRNGSNAIRKYREMKPSQVKIKNPNEKREISINKVYHIITKGK